VYIIYKKKKEVREYQTITFSSLREKKLIKKNITSVSHVLAKSKIKN
jgi:hypothetical protein